MYEGLYLETMREIADLRGKIYDLEKDCLRLMAENKRLREALMRIVKASLPHEEPVSREIARAALDGK